ARPAVPTTTIAAAAAKIAARVALMLLSFRPGSGTLTRKGVEREQVERDVRCGERRRLARAVVGRRDLDDVGPGGPQTPQRPEERDRPGCREPGHLGRPRTRRERGVEEVDVEGEEGGPIADALVNCPRVRGGTEGAKLLARHDREPERPRVVEIGGGVERPAHPRLQRCGRPGPAVVPGAPGRAALAGRLAQVTAP